MKTRLYYFSGTGNCLALARKIAESLDDAEIIPINSVRGGVDLEGKSAGIIFPVYYQDMPKIVKEFVMNSKFNRESYIFAISTYGEMAGFAIGEIEKLLKKRGGILSTGFTVRMPGNYNVLVDLVTPLEKQRAFLDEAYKMAEQIAVQVEERAIVAPENPGTGFNRFAGAISGFVHYNLYKLGTKFKVEAGCNSCSTCEKVCPVGNIRVEGEQGGVKWLDDCQHCLACMNYCPREVIENGKGTKGRLRYRNPDISLIEMYK